MITAVIMQPTYLPWLGYFDLMDQSDVFIFFDSVQFEKRSWQQRNRIKTPSGELLLTIPVHKKGKFDQKICEVKIDKGSAFYEKHIKAIKYNYVKAKYFKEFFPPLKNILERNDDLLLDLTVQLIEWQKNVLGIKAKTVRSSEFNLSSTREFLLVDICKKVGADRYLSPLRSKDYIKDGQVFKAQQIDLVYHQYEHPVYQQLFGDFMPYLSTLDLFFNCGPESLTILRSGRRPSVSAI